MISSLCGIETNSVRRVLECRRLARDCPWVLARTCPLARGTCEPFYRICRCSNSGGQRCLMATSLDEIERQLSSDLQEALDLSGFITINGEER